MAVSSVSPYRNHTSPLPESPYQISWIVVCRTARETFPGGKVQCARLASRILDNSRDRKSTRLNSSHSSISYAVFCLKKKKLVHHHQGEQRRRAFGARLPRRRRDRDRVRSGGVPPRVRVALRHATDRRRLALHRQLRGRTSQKQARGRARRPARALVGRWLARLEPAAPAPAGRARRSRFFFNDTATTEIYTLSLHDALPIWLPLRLHERGAAVTPLEPTLRAA